MKVSVKFHCVAENKNMGILKQLILDCMCFLAKQEMPFRDHDKPSDSKHRRNYIELWNLLRNYDVIRANHLKERTTVFYRTFP